jgi:hypothetical protein
MIAQTIIAEGNPVGAVAELQNVVIVAVDYIAFIARWVGAVAREPGPAPKHTANTSALQAIISQWRGIDTPRQPPALWRAHLSRV